MSTSLSVEDAMRAALSEAHTARGRTAPNPPVGAVLLEGGQITGRGSTQPPGGPHAEVMALRDCRARGHDPALATMVVTLEPCRHHGRTPPCTQAIVAAGVRRVVVGITDPTLPMQGRSIEALRAAGVEVELGVLAEACTDSMRGWLRAVTLGLPEVTLKVATSADGAVATATGESQWITSPEAREAGRALRAEHDAIVVGIGTALADDPRLTTRLEGRGDPVPVVLDTALRLPAGCQLDRPETIVFCADDAPARSLQAEVVRLGLGRPDVRAVAQALAARGLHRVMVEGGAEVARSFLDAGLVDRVEQFVAGRLLPGGRGWVGGPPRASLQDGPRLTLDSLRRVGPDAWLRWRAERNEPCSPD